MIMTILMAMMMTMMMTILLVTPMTMMNIIRKFLPKTHHFRRLNFEIIINLDYFMIMLISLMMNLWNSEITMIAESKIMMMNSTNFMIIMSK